MRGGVWVFTSVAITKFLDIIQMVILMRLLLPEDFGRAAIVFIMVTMADVFSETGVEAALIQRKKVDGNTLDTAWTIFIIRGAIVFAILFLVSPLISTFFENLATPLMIRVAAAGFLVTGFNNVGMVLFKRDLYFGRLVLAQVFVAVLNTISIVILAILLRNVWAIIGGYLLRVIFNLVSSYFVHPYRPSFSWRKDVAKQILGFGKYIFGSRVIIFLINKGDDALVGKLLGSSPLGFYTLAYRLSNLPATHLTHILSRLTFPLYSRLQDNISTLREAYLKAFRLIRLLAFPLATLLLMLSREIVMTVFGEKWLPMLPAMRVLCIYGLLRALIATGGSIIVALGRPKIDTVIATLHLIVMASLIFPLTLRFGILGAAISTLVGLGVIFVPAVVINCRLIGLRFYQWLTALTVPITGSLVIILIVSILKAWMTEPGWFSLTVTAAIGIICYGIVILILERDTTKEIRDIISAFKG